MFEADLIFPCDALRTQKFATAKQLPSSSTAIFPSSHHFTGSPENQWARFQAANRACPVATAA